MQWRFYDIQVLIFQLIKCQSITGLLNSQSGIKFGQNLRLVHDNDTIHTTG